MDMENYPPELVDKEQLDFEIAKAEIELERKIEELEEQIEDGQHDQALVDLFHEDDLGTTKQKIVRALARKLAKDAA